MPVNCGIASCNTYSDTLQLAADKYLDGKYAIRARSIRKEDLKVFNSYDNFWLEKKGDTRLYYSNGDVSTVYDDYAEIIKKLYYVPIAVLNVENSSLINVGDTYNVLLGDINEWLIISNDVANNQIEIVPKYAPVLDFSASNNDADVEGLINSQRSKYYNYDRNNVNVDYVTSLEGTQYVDKLNAINYGQLNSKYKFYAGYEYVSDSESITWIDIKTERIYYDMYCYYVNGNVISNSRSSIEVFSSFFETGFRPVVTLKYSDEEKDGKDKNDELEIGDYVKYSANAYNNWRVLDIDKENNTVDIISGGIVSNISLEGKEDYDNLSTLLQVEVNKYKVGEDAVAARALEIDDLDNLRLMKDDLRVKYFLNNKTKYRPNGSSEYITYVVGIGYYDPSVSQLVNDWAILEYEGELDVYHPIVGAYQYTAGLRPIITLKLSEVEEIVEPSDKEDIDKTNDSLEEKQTEANQTSEEVVKNVEIIEENIIIDNESGTNDSEIKSENSIKEEHVYSLRYIIKNKLQDKVYQKFIILSLIMVVLTIIILVSEKIKNWFKKCNKRKLGVVAGVMVLGLMIITVLSKNLPFSKIKGSVYEIDDVQVGDDFNYTANGYSDWEVLSIDRENKTLEIVSKTSVEDLTIPCIDRTCSDYSDTLQQAANKYVDGEYVISARSITNVDQIRNYDDKEGYVWLNNKSGNSLYYAYYKEKSDNYEYREMWISGDSYSTSYIVPVVTLNVSDSSLYLGKTYYYNLNGISSWVILYKDASTISIIPKSPKTADLSTNRNGTNIQSYVASEIEEYKDDNVVSVRSISSEDISALDNIGYRKGALLTGNFVEKTTGENKYSSYSQSFVSFKNEVISYKCNKYYNYYPYYCQGYSSYVTSSSYTTYSYTAGFRPVIKIKYSDKENPGKDLESDLEVGDYVKYSANGYNSWKVLDIDKSKGTVDIISAGSVQNLTLEGKDDYDNFATIIQGEVDKYKVGDSAVSARIVEHSDFDSLSKINERTSVKFILGNKIKYLDLGTSSYGCNDGKCDYYPERNMAYGFGVGYYKSRTNSMDYDWAILERETGDNESSGYYINGYYMGSYEYTVGLRPIITLKLSQVEKEEDSEEIEEDATKKDEEIEEEQNKLNSSDKVQKPVNNKKIKKENIIYIQSIIEERTVSSDNNSDENNTNNLVDKTQSESELVEEVIINKSSKKRTIAICLIILSIVLLALAGILKLIKFRVLNKKDFRVK